MAKKKKIGEVTLYGGIYPWGENSASRFMERFEEARTGMDEMNIKMHTDGGDVMEGTAIYNYIKNCGIPVNVYVVGIAASMGTVIMLSAQRVYMCENSYIMVHAPSGGCYGTAGDMEKAGKCLRGIEKNFKKVYATKTGSTEKEIEDLLVGDNWFTAQEAVDAKLIDGIVTSIATDVAPVSAEELKTQTPTALYHRFSACLASKHNSINDQEKNEMNKEEMINRFGLTGVTAQSSDESVQAALQAKIKKSEERAEQAENKLREAEEKRIKDAVKAAKDEGKITAEQVSLYEDIGQKSGMDTLTSVLAGLKSAPSLVEATRGGLSTGVTGSAGTRANWNWEQWQKEDPRGLEAMSSEEPEKFEALYKAAFGK